MQTFTTYVSEFETKYSLTPVWRPFPDDLVASMTARPTQNQTVSLYKEVELIQKKVYYCSSIRAYKYSLHSTFYRSTGVPAGPLNVPVPPWEAYLRNKIHGDLVNFADTIGEWREAVAQMETVGRTAKKSFRAARAMLRHSTKRRAWRLWFRDIIGRSPYDRWELQDVVSGHLAIKFGIAPTVGLLGDVVEKLDHVSLQGVRRAYSFSRTANDKLVTPGLYGGKLVTEEKVNVRGKAWVVLDPARGKFTAGNLASALWAGTRLSFMLDWFIDVGSYLEAITALEGVRSMKMYVTTRRTTKWTDSRNQNANTSTKTYIVNRPGVTFTRAHTREIFSTVPFPRTVEVRTSASWGKLLSTVEILFQLRRAVKPLN
jgi:hypothetical protein